MIAVAALVLALAGSPVVTPHEYNQALPNMPKHRVERIFDTHGLVVTEWAGGQGWVHLLKTYPASDGGRVWIVYRHAPGRIVFHLKRKEHVAP